MAVDACGFPIELDFTGGEIHDYKTAPALIDKLSASVHTIADKSYDSENLLLSHNFHMLVYYETHSTYIEAARREKRFKKWCRPSKINLIEEFNPEWHDLCEDICF